ncbi:hypothetical protein OIU77_006396 [Salix suchowensis]|uniref:Uncharacterized protein n=1 Tax=Salix suchowensis TaxID=1278906 RepID=A0ABQ9AKK2_9ROSI|nr:hypothetical protein OIU77_006396 [Salix suchowensis]
MGIQKLRSKREPVFTLLPSSHDLISETKKQERACLHIASQFTRFDLKFESQSLKMCIPVPFPGSAGFLNSASGEVPWVVHGSFGSVGIFRLHTIDYDSSSEPYGAA